MGILSHQTQYPGRTPPEEAEGPRGKDTKWLLSQLVPVYGHKDADGFYRGECAGRVGYIPCNMVSEVQVDSDASRKQLLQDGHIPASMLMGSLGGNANSPPPQRTAVRPPKPQRSKKVERDKQEGETPRLGIFEGQDLSSEDDTPRTMVAIFDYNPKESSPNVGMGAELKFCTGDSVTVVGSMDDDRFCFGEVKGRKGLVPYNFLEAVPSDGLLPGEPRLGRQARNLDFFLSESKVENGPVRRERGKEESSDRGVADIQRGETKSNGEK
ncbi:UNVERIFIED_CONTAM: hypothetical protein K2H54_022345 [Gekko kuhli]